MPIVRTARSFSAVMLCRHSGGFQRHSSTKLNNKRIGNPAELAVSWLDSGRLPANHYWCSRSNGPPAYSWRTTGQNI